ncbi:ERF family protein [Mesorhizobium sp. M8A.F.Ca.ET.165.01.1.1]|uniref:ERF family protein n=1 Tax=Mesorhizobium sp. M8A.F.Ca.ET.165.01.1.1 TaxID=2563960 RepID=UPI001093E806|nr:ERF family protein [Mesorhizobium sp. M8A.F.Ca.ET.165.01.1.1]TGT42766.1 hypothetical protein EN808_12855 [Mesorhizobium sp. M8A.F.Ca.ET.165.01.1.1]
MKAIASALLKVQQELDPIHKGRQGYGYKYADLPAVMDACLDALNKHGVVVVQAPVQTDKSAAAILTRLIDAESGEEITGIIEVPYGDPGKMSLAQTYGSAMTYARRYALVSMLGIVTEDDDGASAGSKPKAQVAAKPSQVVNPRVVAWKDKVWPDVQVMSDIDLVTWAAQPDNHEKLLYLKSDCPDIYAEFAGLGIDVQPTKA